MWFHRRLSLPCILPLVAWLFGLCAARILDIFSPPDSQSLLYLSRLYIWKCDSTPEINLQQFNILTDIRVFRRGQLTHFPIPISCINHLGGGRRVGPYSDLECQSNITLTLNYIHLLDGYSKSYFQFYLIHNLWFCALLKTLWLGARRSCSQRPIMSLMAYHEKRQY